MYTCLGGRVFQDDYFPLVWRRIINLKYSCFLPELSPRVPQFVFHFLGAVPQRLVVYHIVSIHLVPLAQSVGEASHCTILRAFPYRRRCRHIGQWQRFALHSRPL